MATLKIPQAKMTKLTIIHSETSIRISFAFDRTILHYIKRFVKSARWNATQKYWEAPAGTNLDLFKSALADWCEIEEVFPAEVAPAEAATSENGEPEGWAEYAAAKELRATLSEQWESEQYKARRNNQIARDLDAAKANFSRLIDELPECYAYSTILNYCNSYNAAKFGAGKRALQAVREGMRPSEAAGLMKSEWSQAASEAADRS